MEVSVEVHKIIIWAIYSTVFFTSGGAVDDVLVSLLLVEEITKDSNLMYISFIVKHQQTFQELGINLSSMSRTISNMYICIPI